MNFDQYEFQLGGWWASALINGDDTGLTAKEAAQLDAFTNEYAKKHPRGHWDGFSEDDSLGFCIDEISGFAGDCYKVRYVFPIA